MDLGESIVFWYENNKRDLPWRTTKDPYHIWISEIILQQTRVLQGIPYYLRFINRFPNIIALANAPIDEILNIWQGLGYYSRAHNMHYTATYIMNNLGGKFPISFLELGKLKGIGDYTAAAIASICFEESVSVLDGNVIRVLSRLMGIFFLPSSPNNKIYYKKIANSLMSTCVPSLFNQGIMEFGALVCKPVNPNCLDCPVNKYCSAYRNDQVAFLPIKKPKIKQRERFFNYFILKENEHYIFQKRDNNDIWPGLLEFPLLESKERLSWHELTKFPHFPTYIMKSKNEDNPEFIEKTQILSHQKIYTRYWLILGSLIKNKIPETFIRASEENLNKYAFSKVTHQLVIEFTRSEI
jgi:A/G-specific adenine glycosylase